MSVGIATAAAFEKEPSLVQEHALGELYETADGRRYRYGKVGSGAGVGAGQIVNSNVTLSEVVVGVSVLAPAPRRGSTRVSIPQPSGTYPANLFAGGMLTIAGVGVGAAYRIDHHTLMGAAGAAAGFPSCDIYLATDDPLLEDLVADTSFVRLTPSPYTNLVLFTAGAGFGPALGVAVASMSANTYGWFQVRGIGAIRAGAAITGQARLFPLAGGSCDGTATAFASVGVALGGTQSGWTAPCVLTCE